MTFVQFELQMISLATVPLHTSYPGTNIASGHNINHVRGVTISEKVCDFKKYCMTVVTFVLYRFSKNRHVSKKDSHRTCKDPSEALFLVKSKLFFIFIF